MLIKAISWCASFFFLLAAASKSATSSALSPNLTSESNLDARSTTFHQKDTKETARHFESLLQQHKYEEASALLAEGIHFASPLHKFKGKKEWIKGFPKAHKTIKDVEFGDFEPVANNLNQVQRRGKKKIAFVTVTVKQVFEVDENGKINSIVASKD